MLLWTDLTDKNYSHNVNDFNYPESEFKSFVMSKKENFADHKLFLGRTLLTEVLQILLMG